MLVNCRSIGAVWMRDSTRQTPDKHLFDVKLKTIYYPFSQLLVQTVVVVVVRRSTTIVPDTVYHCWDNLFEIKGNHHCGYAIMCARDQRQRSTSSMIIFIYCLRWLSSCENASIYTHTYRFNAISEWHWSHKIEWSELYGKLFVSAHKNIHRMWPRNWWGKEVRWLNYNNWGTQMRYRSQTFSIEKCKPFTTIHPSALFASVGLSQGRRARTPSYYHHHHWLFIPE